MARVQAWGVTEAGAPVHAIEIERREPGAHDVVVDIDFCGVCHSDIHTARGEWGAPILPLVTGHEIVGKVVAIGDQVTKFSVGDRAGVGVIVDSCGDCQACNTGFENYCLNGSVGTYNSRMRGSDETTLGGYSSSIVVDERFVLRVPESLDPAAAAPLLCAGITLWSPLRHWNAGPGKRVAIMGLGGLGHMGVKLAHALGAHVTVLSHSEGKREQALALGADDFITTSDVEQLRSGGHSFDLILNTVSAQLDINEYIRLLKWDGTLVILGLPGAPLSVDAGGLMDRRRSLAASGIGGMTETQEMLDFCGEHGIVSEIERIAPSYINQSWDRVVASDVRYRFVIDIKA